MRFGYFLTPVADDYGELARQARLAEDLGLDLLGIQDHPCARPGKRSTPSRKRSR